MKYDDILTAKWSEKALDDGFTALPNSLIANVGELGLSPTDFLILTCIESFRWTTDRPWPSQQRLGQMAGIGRRQVNNSIRHMKKDLELINVRSRKNTSALYDVSPLIKKLESVHKNAPIGVQHSSQ